MSRRCTLAHNDAARAIVHDGLRYGLSVHAIARSVNQHRISQSAVRRYIRRYNHELHRLEAISAGGLKGSAYHGSTKADPFAGQGSLGTSADMNSLFDQLVVGLGVVANRDVIAKEARIRANPAANMTRQANRGLSRETVNAIRQMVLGVSD